MEVEEPVACGDFASFHFHTTLAGMLGATLIWDEVVQVCKPGEKRLLAATWVMKPFHGEELAVDGVVRLIQHRAPRWHLRVGEDGIPAGVGG